MKIGMIADAYKPHISGVTNYIALNKAFMERLGHEVYVFTFSYEDYQDDEANIIRSPGVPLRNTGFYFSLRYSSKAVRLLRSMDVVHVHHPFVGGSLALRYCRPQSIPILFTNHTRYDLYAHVYMPMVPDALSEAAIKAYLPSFCRSVDLVISPSQGMREILERFGVDAPIAVVPNGVDLAPFRNKASQFSRKDFGYNDQDVLFVYIGRLGLEKNLGFLLRSFAGVAHTYPQAQLILIGDGPEKNNLSDMARQLGIDTRVRFTGLLPYKELPRYLGMMDAFVTASFTEVHPLTVIEAMAAGLPVVGMQSPGVGDTVIDGETGFLAPLDDLAQFTAKFGRLAAEPTLRRSMGEKSGQCADQYAIERTTQLMLEHYQRLAEQTSAHRRSFWSRLKRSPRQPQT
jgi:glycosyltransferase involved in cell wall biosynthesis